MTKTVLFIFFLFNFISIWSQERYFANASSGLIVREEASANAARTGKLAYGSLVNILDKTSINYEVIEDGNTIQSEWVKVKYDNFPYLDTNDGPYERNNKGFVVKYYLQKLIKASLKVAKIDSTRFYQLYKKPIKHTPKKLTSFEEVKKLLSHRVTWGKNNMLADGNAIDKIFLPNGQTLNIDEKNVDFGFVAYYPTEEILLFEGGHSSDYSISIKTGEKLETVGNPEYIIASPKNTVRLNGFFGGQECISYFFQKKVNGKFTYLTEFYSDYDVCTFKEFYWTSETTFIYSIMINGNYSINGQEEFFMGNINTND